MQCSVVCRLMLFASSAAIFGVLAAGVDAPVAGCSGSYAIVVGEYAAVPGKQTASDDESPSQGTSEVSRTISSDDEAGTGGHDDAVVLGRPVAVNGDVVLGRPVAVNDGPEAGFSGEFLGTVLFLQEKIAQGIISDAKARRVRSHIASLHGKVNECGTLSTEKVKEAFEILMRQTMAAEESTFQAQEVQAQEVQAQEVQAQEVQAQEVQAQVGTPRSDNKFAAVVGAGLGVVKDAGLGMLKTVVVFVRSLKSSDGKTMHSEKEAFAQYQKSLLVQLNELSEIADMLKRQEEVSAAEAFRAYQLIERKKELEAPKPAVVSSVQQSQFSHADIERMVEERLAARQAIQKKRNGSVTSVSSLGGASSSSKFSILDGQALTPEELALAKNVILAKRKEKKEHEKKAAEDRRAVRMFESAAVTGALDDDSD